MGKRLLTMVAILLLQGTTALHAQFIWHSNLGDVEMGVVNITYDRTTYTLPCYPEDNPGFLQGVVPSLNSQLSAAGINWISVYNIESGDNSETYDIILSLAANNTTSPRSVIFGTQNRFFSLTQQVQGWSGDPGYSGNGPQVLINDPDTTVWIPPLAQADIRIVMGTYQQAYTLYRYSDWTGGTATAVDTFTCTGDDMHYLRYLTPGRYRFSFQDPDDYFYVRIPEFLGWEYAFEEDEFEVDTTSHNLTLFSETVMTPQGQYYVSEDTDYKLPHLDEVMDALSHGRAPYWKNGWYLHGGMDEDGGLTLYVSVPENTDTASITCFFPDSTGTGWHFRITQTGMTPVLPSLRNPDVVEDDAPIYRIDRDTTALSCFNSIVTHTWNGGNSPEATDVTYFDGLGYPSLEVSFGAGGNTGGSGGLARTDILRPIAYDHLLREDRTYLPYARAATTAPDLPTSAAWTALADTAAFAHQNAWYGTAYPQQMADTSFAWTDIRLESAEGGRPLSAMKPGPEYRHALKKARTRYRGNDTLEVFRLSVSPSTGALSVNGYYDLNTLEVVIERDEDGGELRSYTDREGRKVLERRLLTGDPADSTSTCTWADTYYAYDWAGRPAWVVTPNGSTLLSDSLTFQPGSSFATNHCYIYGYDNRSRVVERRLPGAAPEYMVYDAGGRPVMRQDGNMRSRGEWEATHYDSVGRTVRLAAVRSASSRETLQAAFYAGTPPLAYSRDSVVLRQWYYDGTRPGNAAVSFVERPNATSVGGVSLRSSSEGGLLTYEKINVLGSAAFSEKAHYYDAQGREIQTVQSLPGVGTLRTSRRYDLRGNVLFQEDICGQDTLRTGLSYDSRGRATSECSTLGDTGYAEVNRTYDALGRLVQESFTMPSDVLYGGMDANYSYTPQGWLKEKRYTADQTFLCVQQFHYYDPIADAAPAWTGRISSEYVESTAVEGFEWEYSYDRAGRLTDAIAWLYSDPVAEEGYTYDRNGNITRLYRDDYDWETTRLPQYSGNRRQNCTYDANGNVTSEDVEMEGNETPDLVEYNRINLPSYSDNTEGVWMKYLADGTKLSVLNHEDCGYAYAGPFRYWSDYGDLEFESAAAAGGRIAVVGYLEANGYATVGEPWARYFLTDHRGSTVGVFNGFAGMLDEDWYFPSGAKISVPAPSYVNNNDYLYCGKERQTFFGQGGWYDFGARYLDTEGHFTSLDPLCEKTYPVSPYSFCAGDPVNYVDPDGCIWDTFLDAASLSLGVKSLSSNIKEGNYKGAIVDGIGIALDAAALATPFVSAGAGVAIKAVRGVDKASDAAQAVKTADRVSDVGKDVKNSKVLEATARGRRDEAATLDVLGEMKNTKSYPVKLKDGTTKTVIPDSIDKTTIIEVKSTKNVSNTRQIQAERQLANDMGYHFVLITGENTHISKNIPLSDVLRTPTLGPK